MRDAAADRTLVADRRMRDVRRGRVIERRVPGDQRIGQHLAMPGERADTQPVALQFDAAKCRDMGDVDQQLRRLQTQGERRHQTLAAGNVARIFAAIRECLERLHHGGGPSVAECPRLQRELPAVSSIPNL